MSKGNPRKAEGTDWDRQCREWLSHHGATVGRLAEEGSNDQGDLVFTHPMSDTPVVAECKTGEAINPATVWRKAYNKMMKTPTTPMGVAWDAIVLYRRLCPLPEGGLRRRVDSYTVTMSLDTFGRLLLRLEALAKPAP